MYIIACRAHFCLLLGLGQVGHSPSKTSRSDGTLDWGPMWSGSQSTCHLQCTPTPPMAPNTPSPPYTPYAPIPLLDWVPRIPASPQCTPDTLPAPMHPVTPTPPRSPWCHLYPCWPLSTYTPCQPQCTPGTLYTHWRPHTPWCHLYFCWSWVPMLPTSHPCTPNTPDSLSIPLIPPPLGTPDATYTLLAPEYLHFLPAPNVPLAPPTPSNGPPDAPYTP